MWEELITEISAKQQFQSSQQWKTAKSEKLYFCPKINTEVLRVYVQCVCQMCAEFQLFQSSWCEELITQSIYMYYGYSQRSLQLKMARFKKTVIVFFHTSSPICWYSVYQYIVVSFETLEKCVCSGYEMYVLWSLSKGACSRKWLNLKSNNFNILIFTTQLLPAHVQYICNISA